MTTRNDKLFLHQEILLLALRDQKGTIESGTMYQYALGGAILSELLLAKRIAVDESRRKKLVDMVSAKPLGDPVMDECLSKISTAKRRASLQTWVSKLSRLKNLKHRIAEGLCDRGILRSEQDKVLFIFNRKVYPERNPAPEKALIQRLRKAIFSQTRDIDPRTVVLISLAQNAGLLKVPFDKKRLKERKARIEQLTNGELIGKATKAAVQAAQAAVIVTCIVPAIAVIAR
jgi:hypothetical protein